ncbi:transposase [Lacrimispora sp.]|uniref:transposase n=1 Tax=Lacrimispora sp. TaxID=2719234 RepID=UPI003FA5A0B8
MKEYDERFRHLLGYRRMALWINHFNHINFNKKRIHRIMKKLNIRSIIRKKRRSIHLL